jgi:hypothetical protein
MADPAAHPARGPGNNNLGHTIILLQSVISRQFTADGVN